jgi:hypothetical protein
LAFRCSFRCTRQGMTDSEGRRDFARFCALKARLTTSQWRAEGARRVHGGKGRPQAGFLTRHKSV